MRHDDQEARPEADPRRAEAEAIAICRVAVVVRVRGFVHQVGIAWFCLQGIELVHVVFGPGDEVHGPSLPIDGERAIAE